MLREVLVAVMIPVNELCLFFFQKYLTYAEQWFKSYLTNRQLYISLEDVESDKTLMTHGVPQGSIGPLLFLIVINDIPSCANFFNFTLFADGSTFSCKFAHTDVIIINFKLGLGLKKKTDWLRRKKK